MRERSPTYRATMIDHDRLFKELITTFFVEFLELFLPRVADFLDRNSITFLDKELFTDVTEGERFEADVVVRCRFRDQDAFFIIHVEHQSYAQADFGRRMLRYWARLFEKYGIPVYPIVIYSFDTPRRKQETRYSVSFPDFTPLRFEYRVIQLNRLRWRTFVNQPNPLASALMAKMQFAEKDRPRVKFECLRLLATLKLDRARMHLISGFVDTYLRLSAAENRSFRNAVTAAQLEEQEEVMEIVTSWMEEGLEKGRQEGLQQGLQLGRQEGIESVVLRQLERRFGPLPSSITARIDSLPEQQLGDLAVALLDFADRTALDTYLSRLSA